MFSITSCSPQSHGGPRKSLEAGGMPGVDWGSSVFSGETVVKVISKCPEECDLQGNRDLRLGAALFSKPSSFLNIPDIFTIWPSPSQSTLPDLGHILRENQRWRPTAKCEYRSHKASALTQAMALSPACTLESPAELKHTQACSPTPPEILI